MYIFWSNTVLRSGRKAPPPPSHQTCLCVYGVMQNPGNSCNFSRNGPEMLLPPHCRSQQLGFDSGPSNLIAMVTGGLSTVRPPANITRARMGPGGPFCTPSMSCPPSIGRGELKAYRRVNTIRAAVSCRPGASSVGRLNPPLTSVVLS